MNQIKNGDKEKQGLDSKKKKKRCILKHYKELAIEDSAATKKWWGWIIKSSNILRKISHHKGWQVVGDYSGIKAPCLNYSLFCNWRNISFAKFWVSRIAISSIVIPVFICLPQDENAWIKIAAEFENQILAVDGKHIVIKLELDQIIIITNTLIHVVLLPMWVLMAVWMILEYEISRS